ncbi:hypothetical protein OG21DRAFT_262619 [Imleria badia]|nr:hypothetical protein OG21DRAFT_262619 [Imleria badia]
MHWLFGTVSTAALLSADDFHPDLTHQPHRTGLSSASRRLVPHVLMDTWKLAFIAPSDADAAHTPTGDTNAVLDSMNYTLLGHRAPSLQCQATPYPSYTQLTTGQCRPGSALTLPSQATKSMHMVVSPRVASRSRRCNAFCSRVVPTSWNVSRTTVASMTDLCNHDHDRRSARSAWACVGPPSPQPRWGSVSMAMSPLVGLGYWTVFPSGVYNPVPRMFQYCAPVVRRGCAVRIGRDASGSRTCICTPPAPITGRLSRLLSSATLGSDNIHVEDGPNQGRKNHETVAAFHVMDIIYRRDC